MILFFIFGAVGGLLCFLNGASAQVVPHIPVPQVHVVIPKIHVRPPQVHVVTPRIHVVTPQVHVAPPTIHVGTPQVHVAGPQVHPDSPHIHLPNSRLAGGSTQPVQSPSTGPKALEPNLAASTAMHKGKSIDPVVQHVERGNALPGNSTQKNSAVSQQSVTKNGMSPATAACDKYCEPMGGGEITTTTDGRPQHTVAGGPQPNPMSNPAASDSGANMGSGPQALPIVPHPQAPPKAPTTPAPTLVNNSPPPVNNPPPPPTSPTTPVNDPAPAPVNSPTPTLVTNSPAPTPTPVHVANPPSAPPQVAAPTPAVAPAPAAPSQPAMPVLTNTNAGPPNNGLTPPNVSGTVATLLNPPPLNGGDHDPFSSTSQPDSGGASSSYSWDNALSWGSTSNAGLGSSPIFAFVSNNPGSAALIGAGFVFVVASGGAGLPGVLGAGLMASGLLKSGGDYLNSGAVTAPIANFK